MIIQKTSLIDVLSCSQSEFISLKEKLLQTRRPMQLIYNHEQPVCTWVIITSESINSNTVFPTIFECCNVEWNSHFLPNCPGFKTDRRILLSTLNNTDQEFLENTDPALTNQYSSFWCRVPPYNLQCSNLKCNYWTNPPNEEI